MTKHLTTEQKTGDRLAVSDRRAVVQRWPDVAARAWTFDFVEDAKSKRAVLAVVATGSSVRNVEFSDDLDLLLIYQGACPKMQRPPISIDLRRYERDDVLQKLADGHDYLSWTVRYGRKLFEHGSWWTTLRTDWRGCLPLPSVDDARERAKKAERLYREMIEVGDADAAADLRLSMLTFLGRAALSEASVFPKSRPEIPTQLRKIGERALADRLHSALQQRQLRKLAELTTSAK